MRRIGVLMHTTADKPDAQAQMAAFLQGLQVAGWEVGRNLRIETRWSGGDPARLRENAADLVALNPDVIMAGSGPTLPAVLQATRTVPIVFAQGDRSDRRRLCQEPGAAGRQRDRLPRSSNTVWPGNGSSCSKRSCRGSSAWGSSGKPRRYLGHCQCGRSFRPSRRAPGVELSPIDVGAASRRRTRHGRITRKSRTAA